jgi:hypothetical protein
MMKCECGGQIIWGGDDTFEDYGLDGEGMVSNGKCQDCPISVLVYRPSSGDEPTTTVYDSHTDDIKE